MKSLVSLFTVGAYLTEQVIAVSSAASRKVAFKQMKELEVQTYGIANNISTWDGTGDVLRTALNNIHEPAIQILYHVTNATKELTKFPTSYNIDDSFRLATIAQDLAYAVNITIAKLNKKEPLLTAAAVGAIAQDDLQKLIDATTNYADLLISYVPKKLRPVAVNLKVQAVDSLYMGLHCFNLTGVAKELACSTAEIDPHYTRNEALRFGAIRRDGSPIA